MKKILSILCSLIISLSIFIPIDFAYADTQLPVADITSIYAKDLAEQYIDFALANDLDWLIYKKVQTTYESIYIYLYDSTINQKLHLFKTADNKLYIRNTDNYLYCRDATFMSHIYTDYYTGELEIDPMGNVSCMIGTESQVYSNLYIYASSKPIYGLDYNASTNTGTYIFQNYTTAVNKTVSLPPGYAISFKKIPNVTVADDSFILKENTPLGVPLYADTWSYGTYYKYTDDYLTPEYSKNMLSFDTIDYDVDRSLFKVNYITKKVTFNSSLDTISFFNPVIYSISPTNKNSNGTKTIVYPANSYTVKLYNIVTSDKFGFILEGYDDSDFQYNDDDPNSSESLPYFTDADGNIIDIPDGGSLNNEDPGTYTQESVIDDIKQFIDNFKNTIINLFAPATGAISTLISAGGAFMSVVANMFTWLPSPVVSVIQSGLILLVVIGVLKMLL